MGAVALAWALAAPFEARAWTWPADGPVVREFSLGDNPYAGAAPRDRRRARRRRERARPGVRRGHVRRGRADARPHGDDRDAGRAQGVAHPPRPVARPPRRCSRGRDRRSPRQARGPGARRPVRAPGRSDGATSTSTLRRSFPPAPLLRRLRLRSAPPPVPAPTPVATPSPEPAPPAAQVPRRRRPSRLPLLPAAPISAEPLRRARGRRPTRPVADERRRAVKLRADARAGRRDGRTPSESCRLRADRRRRRHRSDAPWGLALDPPSGRRRRRLAGPARRTGSRQPGTRRRPGRVVVLGERVPRREVEPPRARSVTTGRQRLAGVGPRLPGRAARRGVLRSPLAPFAGG